MRAGPARGCSVSACALPRPCSPAVTWAQALVESFCFASNSSVRSSPVPSTPTPFVETFFAFCHSNITGVYYNDNNHGKRG